MTSTSSIAPPLTISNTPIRDSKSIHFEMGPLETPEALVNKLSAVQGPVDLYCWYEGPQGIPKIGAHFWREKFFLPLLSIKEDALFYLYSLKGWDFQKKVTQIAPSSPVGNAINSLEHTSLKCIYAFEFFKYCQNTSGPLHQYITQRMPKEFLTNLSKNFPEKGLKVGEFFESRQNLIEPLNDQDVSLAYSHLQYVEAYYLIRNSVERGLKANQKSVQVAFILPNDEAKYYTGFQADIEKMLHLEFGAKLDSVSISVTMNFFHYGDNISARPYIDKSKGGKLTPKEIREHFAVLPMRRISSAPVHPLSHYEQDDDEKGSERTESAPKISTAWHSAPAVPRDMIHHLND